MGKRRRSRQDYYMNSLREAEELELKEAAAADKLEQERLDALAAKEEQARDQVRTAKLRQRTILTGGADRGTASSKTSALTSLLGGR